MNGSREDEMSDKIKRLKRSLREVTQMVDHYVQMYESSEPSPKKTHKSSVRKSHNS
jgi:hypothetical protein